jgi:hypothetical protein
LAKTANRSEAEILRLMELAADDFDELARCVGYFVLLWANAEQWLEMCVAVIYRGLGGDVCMKKMPQALSRKLEFMEDCFARLPGLAHRRGHARRVVAGFRKLSSIRHELIHGAIGDAFIKGTKYEFYKFDLVEGKIHETRTFTLELIRQAPKLHDQVQLLEQRTMDLFYQLHALWKRNLLRDGVASRPKGAWPPRFVDLPAEKVLMREGQARKRRKTHR